MLEYLLASYLLPLLQKLGSGLADKLIDRITEGMDNAAQALLRKMLKKGSIDEKELSGITKDESQKRILTKNVERLSFGKAVIDAIDPPSFAKRGGHLPYYADIIDGLGAMSNHRGRDVAISGFLASPLAVTVIQISDTKSTVDRSNGEFLLCPQNRLNLFVKFYESEVERDDALQEVRDEIGLTKTGRVPESIIRSESYFSVKRIYDNFVTLVGAWPDSDIQGLSDLTRHQILTGTLEELTSIPKQIRDKLRIVNYDGIHQMLDSVAKLAKDEAASQKGAPIAHPGAP